MKKILFYFILLSVVILQSCGVHNSAQLSSHSFLNRLVEVEKVKPFERVLIVFDDYEVPHTQWLNKIRFNEHLVIDLLKKRGVDGKVFQKNYENRNPIGEIKEQVNDYKPTHLVLVKQCLSNENMILYDVEIEDCSKNENIFRGRLSTQNLPKGLIQVFEKDGFLKATALSVK